MMRTRWTSVVMVALLGMVVAAHAAAQQDSNAPPQPRPRLRTAPAEPGAPGAPRPRLGVMVEQTTDGLRIKEVLEASLAEAAGVQPQDVLLRIGDERLSSVADVQRALQAYRPGDSVSIVVIREGSGIVELSAAMPEPTAPPEAQQPSTLPESAAPGHDAVPGPRARADGFRGGFLGVQLVRTPPAAGTERPDGPPDSVDTTDAADSADTADTGDTDFDSNTSTGTAGSAPGVEIESVLPDSAAWYAGLQPGDRLLAIDGTALATAEDLVGAVSSREPGVVVELKFLRDGAEQQTAVRLGARAPSGMQDLFGSMLQELPPGAGAAWGPRARTLPGLPADDDGQGWNFVLPRQVLPRAPQLPFGGGRHGPAGDPRSMLDGLLHDLDLDADGAAQQSVRIELRDGQGTLTVTRDGATETYTLDSNGRWVRSDGGDAQATQPSPTPGGTQSG